MKKYELLKEDFINIGKMRLYRIKALKDFGNVKCGDIGGYIEDERNLSQEGNSWIYGEAKVYGNSRVCEGAEVGGHAWVYGNAEVGDCAWVGGNAMVGGSTKVGGYKLVTGYEEVKE